MTILNSGTCEMKLFEKNVIAVVATASAVLLAVAAGLSVGAGNLTIFDFFRLDWGALFSGDGGLKESLARFRLLRLGTAFLVGGSLSMAGVVYQAVLRNPLAEPYILGVSGGAGLGAAIAIYCGFAVVGFGIPLAAFIGAVLVLSLVLLMARGAGAEFANNAILSGVVIGAVCSSALMCLISVMGIRAMNSVTWWLLGNLEPSDGWMLAVCAVFVLAGGVALYLLAKALDAISLGEEMAFHLGYNPAGLMPLSLGVASLMAAAAVSLAGIIGFVGLIVPHALRRLVGARHGRLLPLSFVFGGVFLVLCDTVARIVLSPRVVPVGVVTALLGGPFFLWALNRKRRRSG